MMPRLVEAVTQFAKRQTGQSPYYTEIEGLIVLRSQAERHPTHIVHKPALCIVVQGAKWTTFGNTRLHYRAGQAMVVSLEMPGFSQVVELTIIHAGHGGFAHAMVVVATRCIRDHRS
jgi:hypothetical protein